MNFRQALLAAAALTLCGCTPKVGSQAWCEAMEKKPRGDVTFNEAADFAKYCVLKMKPEGA